MSFTNFGGGLVNTVVAGLGNNISAGLTNQLTSNIQFSVSNVLAGAVQSASGYALNEGSNYLLNQVSSLVPPSIGNGLANAVATQIASVGINAVKGFASQTINNLLGQQNPISGLVGSAGLEGATGKGGFLGLHADGLPDADYGGGLYNLSPDILFSVVPANPGPQTQQPPQTPPKWSMSDAFTSSFTPGNVPLDSFKSSLTTFGPGTGSTPTFGGGIANSYTAGKVSQANNIAFNPKAIPVSW